SDSGKYLINDTDLSHFCGNKTPQHDMRDRLGGILRKLTHHQALSEAPAEALSTIADISEPVVDEAAVAAESHGTSAEEGQKPAAQDSGGGQAAGSNASGHGDDTSRHG
ncbi:MAG: hypothetical protein R6U42_02385, partial [Halomonas sp.]